MKRRRVRNAHRRSAANGKPEARLEQVIHLAEELSPAGRFNLWSHLADLPDSGIKSTNDARSLIRDLWIRLPHNSGSDAPVEEEWKQIGFFGLRRKGNTIIVDIDNVEVLRVTLKPRAFAEHLFQSLPVKPPTEHSRERVRAILNQAGASKSEAEIEAALEESAKQVQDVVIEAKRSHIAARITEKLPLIVGMISDNLIRAFAFEGSNMLFEQAGAGRKFSAEAMQEMVFRQNWAHLKPMLAIRRGAPKGKRAVNRAEKVEFIERARAVSRALSADQRSIRKVDLARGLFGRHAHPLNELNRRLKRYDLAFRDLTD
jgi:hypothetical protein